MEIIHFACFKSSEEIIEYIILKNVVLCEPVLSNYVSPIFVRQPTVAMTPFQFLLGCKPIETIIYLSKYFDNISKSDIHFLLENHHIDTVETFDRIYFSLRTQALL